MATLIRHLDYISIKCGALDMEMSTLLTSLNKMNELPLQWKPILSYSRLFVYIGIYEIECFQVTDKKWKH